MLFIFMYYCMYSWNPYSKFFSEAEIVPPQSNAKFVMQIRDVLDQ